MDEYFIGITDKGRRAEKNEDTFIAQPARSDEYVIACVIDGVGGYRGGEVAAEIARSVIHLHLQDIKGDVIKTLQDAIIAANVEINREKKKDQENENMACVLTCAVTHLTKNKFYYAHVGDTRLYLLRDNSLVKISKDHSVVGFLEESGRLSEEDAMRHPRRNEINKALGFEENIDGIVDFIETGESPFLPGDIILLCSDGLSDMISSNAIKNILTSSHTLLEKARALIDAANEAGGKDNITAVIVKNNKKPKQLAKVTLSERKDHNTKPSEKVHNEKPDQKSELTRKKPRNQIIFLSTLSICVFAAIIFLFFQNYKQVNQISTPALHAAQLPKNENPVPLITYANDTSRQYIFPIGQVLIPLSEPIHISKDSFKVFGNGAHITSDSSYRGAAFNISSFAKYVLLDSLVFENFDIGLIVQKNNVELRHVRFINCKVPIQYLLSLPDSIITGRFKDPILISDSPIK
ncbi:MAG: protein phosphatase 2C domain-containing protein [Ferruginibacter sp.]